MQERIIVARQNGRDRQHIVAGVVVMAVAACIALFLLALNSDVSQSFPYFFLIPWITALAVVLLLPSGWLLYQGKFSFDNPIVFATFSYFFPAFVIGGFALSAGLSQPYFLAYIQDARTNLPFTVQLIMLGFAGLSVGYFLPPGRLIGDFIKKYLSNVEYPDSSYLTPGLALLAIGIVNSVLSLLFGLFGYQTAEEIGAFDGLLFLTTLFWLQASFLLWYVIFKKKAMDINGWIIIGILIATSLGKALFAGNRGSLIQIFTIIVLAYILADRKFKLKQMIWSGILLFVAVVAGTIYGTTFRDIKGSESQVGAAEYTESIYSSIDKISRSDQSSLLGSGIATLAERIDTLSSVAVVVSNYEQLAPFEESYGLEDNITKDLITFLIPRFVWNDKPVASEPRKYSELYFNYGENSFAITPIGDLLRNFGVIGVLFGMMLLGIILRAIYRSLIEDQPRMVWRTTLYFMLLTAVSYEGFYGSIIPYIFKIGVTASVGIIFMHLFIRLKGGRRISA